MFELTINGVVYQFCFNMGFLREINKRVSIPVDGVPNIKQNVGLRHTIGKVLDGDVEALVEILHAANRKQDPRITVDALDAYVDDEETNIDELFKMVLDFLEKSNATRKSMMDMKMLYEMEKAKATQ